MLSRSRSRFGAMGKAFTVRRPAQAATSLPRHRSSRMPCPIVSDCSSVALDVQDTGHQTRRACQDNGNPSIGVLQGHRLIPDPKWQVRHIDPALPLNVGGNLLLCGEIRRAGAGGSGPDVRSMSRQDITLRRSVCSASRGKTGYFSVV
jgi:hypothetical protein